MPDLDYKIEIQKAMKQSKIEFPNNILIIQNQQN